jgi:hypothetical protein
VDLTFYGEPHPYQASLSNVTTIIVIMRAFMVKLLCQVVSEWISALECLSLGVRGLLLLHHVLSGIKWPLFPRISALELATRYWQPLGVSTRGPGVCCTEAQGEVSSG